MALRLSLSRGAATTASRLSRHQRQFHAYLSPPTSTMSALTCRVPTLVTGHQKNHCHSNDSFRTTHWQIRVDMPTIGSHRFLSTDASEGSRTNSTSTTTTNASSQIQDKAKELRHKASELRASASEQASALRDRASEYAEKRRQDQQNKPKGLRQMLQAYGPIFVGTYFSLYVATLGTLYSGISNGYIDPMTVLAYLKGNDMSVSGESATTVGFVKDLMNKWSMTAPYAPMVEEYPQIANLGTAWVITKFTEPVRIVAVSAALPYIAPHLQFLSLHRPETTSDDDDKSDGNEKSKEDSKEGKP